MENLEKRKGNEKKWKKDEDALKSINISEY